MAPVGYRVPPSIAGTLTLVAKDVLLKLSGMERSGGHGKQTLPTQLKGPGSRPPTESPTPFNWKDPSKPVITTCPVVIVMGSAETRVAPNSPIRVARAIE